jgi:hypothetical protein
LRGGRGLPGSRRYPAEPRDHGLAGGLEGLADALALAGHGFDLRGGEGIERRAQALDRQRGPQITLVVR